MGSRAAVVDAVHERGPCAAGALDHLLSARKPGAEAPLRASGDRRPVAGGLLATDFRVAGAATGAREMSPQDELDLLRKASIPRMGSPTGVSEDSPTCFALETTAGNVGSAPKPRSPKLLVTSPSLLAAERMALEAELRSSYTDAGSSSSSDSGGSSGSSLLGLGDALLLPSANGLLLPLRALLSDWRGDFDLEYLVYKGEHGVGASGAPRLGTFAHIAAHKARYSAVDRLRAIELMREGAPPDLDTGARPRVMTDEEQAAAPTAAAGRVRAPAHPPTAATAEEQMFVSRGPVTRMGL